MKVGLRNEEIEKILDRENISQNHLARMLGISSGYMSQIMHGSRYPSARLRKRFMLILPGKRWLGILFRYKWNELFKKE